MIIFLSIVSFCAAIWYFMRAHDLHNAVKSLQRQNTELHREYLQASAERTVAKEETRKILRDLRMDPTNPYYVPPVTPQVARRKQNRGNSGNSRKVSGSPSSNSGSSRSDDGGTAAIIATTAAVATYSGYDSGSSYCDSGSSSFDSSCSF